MTLLFAFFVVLYASSQVDKHKMGQLANAIQAAFQELGVFPGQSIGPPIALKESTGAGRSEAEKARIAQDLARVVEPIQIRAGAQLRPDVEQLRRAIEVALAPEIQRKEVALRVGPEGLVISLREVGFFDSGSAAMRPGAEAAFGRIAALLRERDCELRVEGHTDDVPIHTAQFQSNWELSTTRATGIIRELITQYHFSPERLSAAGYGEFHPTASNTTAEGRRLNRRIDLVVMGARSSIAVAPATGRS